MRRTLTLLPRAVVRKTTLTSTESNGGAIVPRAGPTMPANIHVTLDFDCTLSVHDTLAPLASIGYSHAHSSPRTPWSTIVSAYLSDLAAHTSGYPQPPCSRTTIAAEELWLISLAGVEEASAKRAVVEAGIWNGVSRAEVDDAAKCAVGRGEVRLRSNWTSFVRKVIGGGGSVAVCSVNWSRWWIWCCMMHAWETDLAGHEAHVKDDVLRGIAIYANELPSIEMVPGQPTCSLPGLGRSLRLRTAGDKLDCFVSSRADHVALLHEKAIPEVPELPSVYIGDSVSDLLCLLGATVGICMRDDSIGSGQRELEATCTRLGIDLAPISEFDWARVCRNMSHTEGKNRSKRKLWWASCYDEISTSLLSIHD